MNWCDHQYKDLINPIFKIYSSNLSKTIILQSIGNKLYEYYCTHVRVRRLFTRRQKAKSFFISSFLSSKNRWKSQRIKIPKGICSDLRLLKFRAWNSWHFDRRRFYKFEVRIIYISKTVIIHLKKGKKSIFLYKFFKK